MEQHCPQTGKIYVIILFCLVFTSLLTSINVLSKKNSDQETVSDSLFWTGIVVNIIQTSFTLILIGIDLFVGCRNKLTEAECNSKMCKWINVSPPDISKCTSMTLAMGYAYTLVILLSSAYMISFGIMTLMKANDPNDEQEMTSLATASLIAGAVGILFIFSDIVCIISCYCK
jgi:hypothetical protein